ncbi:MAG: EI24 domain-containing protein [Marivita sp.]|uniref:EI24 domain-containing protein n=1 Tax=Marivita sp. TaxID=2003365 RepID=UPI0025BAD0D4|nr:EI24 domain-containing protein [Marivita sp.]MCI5110622.1 EI24 domain-containing protein [Marivita sp.]
MILRSFFLTLGQLADPSFRKVLFLGIGLGFALLVAFFAGLMWLLDAMLGPEATLPFIGEVTWLDDLVSWTALISMIVLSVFLMVPVASAITSMFLDDVADAVEDRHYPHLPKAGRVPFGDALRDTVNFLGVLIAANIFALVLYVMFPPFALFIFWGLNGFLLGREYFTLAAMRREGRAGTKALRKRHVAKIWIAGTLMAMPLSLPLVNLVIPILGAATFTHLYHQIQGQAPSGQRSPDRAR